MPPRLVSHYRVVRRLGAGGMGEVYLAHDTQLERPVALKVMSAELAKDANQRKRFRTEAKAASGLSHPHICVIHEVGETGEGRPFLAMEYVEGQTLDVVLQQRRLKIREVISLGIEVAEALEAAHARGLVHRDIKPGNLMLTQRGQVKVMDFGLAKWFAPDELGGATTSVAHTRTGMLIGTPQYMSPEQALGRPLDPGTDIVSLGVVLYEAVAGQRPFLGKTVVETINNIVNQPPVPLGLDNPVYSPALDNIISKCLAKEPEKRYASAKELAADLRRLKEDSERALAATAQVETPAPVTPSSGERQPTALWKLATKAGAGHSKALRWALGFVAVAMLAVSGWALLGRGGPKPPEPRTNLTEPADQKSIAVLPFVNMSADKRDEYLSDGISEEMITALSKVGVLQVKARTSSFAFKGKNEDIQKIGEQLHVSHLLEGSVAKSGNKLRITAQLIQASNGNHLWSDVYDRDMQDIFAVRSEVAQQVVAALRIQLGVEETRSLVRKPTENLDAYKLYLQGRSLWNRRTSESLRQAIELFNQAIAKDPGYALAYAGLADCYVVLRDYDVYTSDSQSYPQALRAALKALELDSSLAGPHAALASAKAYLEWDWPGAEVEYRRAIALNPNYATAHQWLGLVLRTLGRPEEALAEFKRALEIDPLSPVINVNLAETLCHNGQTDLAIEALQKQIAFDPSFVLAHRMLAGVYWHKGKLSECAAELETARRLLGSEISMLGDLASVRAKAGNTNEARKLLNQMENLQRQGLNYRARIAAVQHVLGDDEAALASLEQAVEEHASDLEYLNFDIFWKDLRPHPRVQAILRKMRLVK